MLSNSHILGLEKAITNKDEAIKILENFSSIVKSVEVDSNKLAKVGKHHHSKPLLPEDFKDGWLPLNATGNGDCLFNSASILLSGDESLAADLRLLTVAELFAHAEFYATHPQFNEIAEDSNFSPQAIQSMLFSRDKAQDTFKGRAANLRNAIEVEAKETSKPYVYSGTFHIMALSSVINKPIYSVYPEIQTATVVKKALHRVFYPREGLMQGISRKTMETRKLHIMWTTMLPRPVESWAPNHFVPLLPKHTVEGYLDIKTYANATRYRARVDKATTKAAQSDSRPSSRDMQPPLININKSPTHETKPSHTAAENMKSEEMLKKPSSYADAARCRAHIKKSKSTSAVQSRPSSSKTQPHDLLPPLIKRHENPTPHKAKPSHTEKMESEEMLNEPSSYMYADAARCRAHIKKSKSTSAVQSRPSSRNTQPHDLQPPLINIHESPTSHKAKPSHTEKMESEEMLNESSSHADAARCRAHIKKTTSTNTVQSRPSSHDMQPPLTTTHENTTPDKTKPSHSEKIISGSSSYAGATKGTVHVTKTKSIAEQYNPSSCKTQPRATTKECSHASPLGMSDSPPLFARLLNRNSTSVSKKVSVDELTQNKSFCPKLSRKKRKSTVTDVCVKSTSIKKSQVTQTSTPISKFFKPASKCFPVKENTPLEVIQTEELVPLRGQEMQWYHDRGVNAQANTARTSLRGETMVISEENELLGFQRGKAKGSLKENVNCLLEKLQGNSTSLKQQEHFKALILVGEYILESGPLVRTQLLVNLYKDSKGLTNSYCLTSASFMETVTRHLNLIQVYIEGTGFVLENQGTEIAKIVMSLKQMGRNENMIINERVDEAVKSDYDTTMKYLDTRRDKDTVKAILTKITSVKHMKRMTGKQDGRAFKRSKDLVSCNLQLFKEMEGTITVEDKDMSEEQRRRKKNRLLQKMKLKRLQHVYEGRGRQLKCEEFPDLAGILEFTFGEEDRIVRAGGGLESHPRLTDTVLYRAADSNTIMKHARETILALAPKGFNICLSTCFNYTQNYREGSYEAKRHHSGRGINACLSLHKPPRTGVEHFVINLHWSTHNVNLALDVANCDPNNILVDSKDAKAKVNSDVCPVQKPAKSWRKITLPDHDWDRTTHNTVTPMTHLFMETELILDSQKEDFYFSVRRTGMAATLLNISYFEPQTVQRIFNELFLLLVNPALDVVFRNPDTGRLKEHFVFIVDNGPAEAPSSPLVCMWLVRLARFLQLKSVTQKSFAEYHSKRNPVERVHAVHNRALSNELFSSRRVHQEYQIGDLKHLENMESMAEEVRQCISRTQYADKPCLALRGIGGEEGLIFKDESELITFMGKSETRKDEDDTNYHPSKNLLFEELITIWDLDKEFEGTYREDYEILQNAYHEEGERTSWRDKYSTVIYNPDVMSSGDQLTQFELQPVPDYVRWVKTGGELHYVPHEKLLHLDTQVINNTPAAFLPSKILEIAYKSLKHQMREMIPHLSLLVWCPKSEVEKFMKEYGEKLDKRYEDDKEREYWSQHELYQKKSKSELQAMAKKEKLPIEGKKHEHVQRLVGKLQLREPPDLEIYCGDIDSLPISVSEISKLSVYKLKEILRTHNVLDCGTKDETVVRVAMLRGKKGYLAFHKEREALSDLISAVRNLIEEEKKMYICDPKFVHKRRRYATPSGPSLATARPRDSASVPAKKQNAFVEVPDGIMLENLEEILDPVMTELLCYNETGNNAPTHEWNGFVINNRDDLAAMRTVGARVLAFWSKEELGKSGWKARWYVGTVKSYDKARDTVNVQFDSEAQTTYKYCVTRESLRGKLKLSKSTRGKINSYEDIGQVGAVVEVYWSVEDLEETDWIAGWYKAEVQAFDYDDDEVDLVFFDEPNNVYKVPVFPSIVAGTLRLCQQVV